MIDLMGRLDFPADAIAERARLRIQYSMTVNRLASARQAALAWLEKHPDDFVARDMLGSIMHSMALHTEAQDALKAVHEADWNNAVKQRRYLEILMVTGAREEALSLCEFILKTNGDNLKSLIQVCESYLQFAQPDKASDIVKRIEALAPTDPYLRYARGQIHQEQQDFAKATEAYAEVPRDDRDWYNAQTQLGLCLLRLRKYEEAARAFVNVLTTNPYDMAANAKLDQALRRMGKREAGNLLWSIRTRLLENFDTIEIESLGSQRRGDLANQTRLLALILDDKRQYRAAEQLLIEACRSLPESIPAKENLAHHHLRTVQACRAEGIYRSLVGQVPAADRDRTTISLVEALLRQGETEEPIALLEGMSPESRLYQSLRALLGTYYLEIEGDEAKALSYLEGVASTSPEVKAPLARSLLGLGKAREAWNVFEQLPSDFDDPVTAMAKVECLARLDQSEQAQSLFEQTLSKHPDLSVLITARARACLASVPSATDREDIQRRTDETGRSLKTIRQLVVEANRVGWPESIPILVKLSDAYAQLGESEEALRYAQLALEGDPRQIDKRRKVIQLMTQPEHVFERLHEIQVLRSMDPGSRDFARETAEALAHIGLTP
jgi:tetratricopeptide (TPR) repeat protein